MTRKSRTEKRKEQALIRRAAQKQIGQQAKASATVYKETVSHNKKTIEQMAAERKAAARARDKELRHTLHEVAKVGLYQPKEFKLTKYRRARIKQLERAGKLDLLNKEEYFFVPITKERRKEAIAKSDQLKIATSKTGIFVPRNGHKRVKLHTDKKTGELSVIRSGKTRWGPNKGRIYSDSIPIASIDDIAKSKERLRKEYAKIGKIDYDKGERIIFHVEEYTEHGTQEGWSRRSWDDDSIDELLEYIDKYENIKGKEKSPAAMVNFYRHITIEKSNTVEWLSRHEPKDVGKQTKIKRTRRGGRFNTRSKKGWNECLEHYQRELIMLYVENFILSTIKSVHGVTPNFPPFVQTWLSQNLTPWLIRLFAGIQTRKQKRYRMRRSIHRALIGQPDKYNVKGANWHGNEKTEKKASGNRL